MLSTLPPELLREIIEATVPHSFHSTTYRTRQTTLCSLSLVSKRFRAIAQPLLLEIVWLQSIRNLNRFLAGSGGGGTNQKQATFVKQAILSYGLPIPPSEDYRNLQEMLSSVTALSMYSVPEAILSCSDLEFLSSLTSLHLSCINWKNPRTFTLPHLESLTLYSCACAFVTSFLDLVALPNLRNFAFADFAVDSFSWSAAFNRLLPGLETLCTLGNEWTGSASAFRRTYVDKTLIMSYVGALSDMWSRRQRFPFAHLLIYGTHLSDDIAGPSLDDFASCIETNPSSSLKTIYLDSSLRNSDSVPSRLCYSVENLARVCLEKKIEVVFEPVPQDFGIDPWILPDFVRRQKQRRSQEKGN